MRTRRVRLIGFLLFALAVCGFAAMPAQAKDSEYEAVVKHLKTRYQAKKQGIPFLGLARFAVKLIRPAGVKSFDVTIFENLKFDNPERGRELRSALPNLLPADWLPLVRVSQNNSDQMLVYAREVGNDIKLIVVQVEADRATVVRVKLSPEKMLEFIQNPKILGISVSD